MRLPDDDGNEVHFTPGYQATKDYTCPECSRRIPVGLGHIVAWPMDDVEERRHWHRGCWRIRVRRGRLA